jgi:PHD/YefM family antitoxin component YafN of YafNO toxin-antitoxin module
MPVAEARKEISTILKSFSDQTQSEPVYIGAHRKAEAVLVPVSVFEYMLDLLDDVAIAKIIAERTSSNQTGKKTRTSSPEEFQKQALAAWDDAHK